MNPSTIIKKKSFSFFRINAGLLLITVCLFLLIPFSYASSETEPSLVQWYPWSQETFDRAHTQDKPLFVSVSYPACYWCYLMQEESFKNPKIAGLLNQHFIPVRVDRQLRPDVDRIYQEALKLVTGAGGWPATFFLTPDGKPFFADTFLPSSDRWGKTGLETVLNEIISKWILERETVESFSSRVAGNMQTLETLRHTAGDLPDETLLRRAASELAAEYDADHGGFGKAPKFPRTQESIFLMRASRRFRNPEYLKMAENTLLRIRHGAIYDHLGGGVFRSAAEADWFLPQFEKMLYDQALLSMAYLELFNLTRNAAYASIAEDILRFVSRDLRSPQGVFYAGLSAGSIQDPSRPGLAQEGAFYVWDEKEIRNAFDAKAAPIVLEHYGVRYEGNVPGGGPYGTLIRKNILYIQDDAMKLAGQYKVSPEFVSQTLYDAKKKLFDMRSKRMPPAVDQSILTDWNALMISALSRAGAMLGKQEYLDQAETAADFILKNRVSRSGILKHADSSAVPDALGFLSDYAYFVQGLLDLYEAGFKTVYLEKAVQLNQKMLELFADPEGGFVMTAGDDTEAPQIRDVQDHGLPAGNAVAVSNLLRLSKIRNDAALRSAAEKHMRAFGGTLEKAPLTSLQMLMNLDWITGPAYEIVISGNPAGDAAQAMQEALRSVYLPQKVVMLHADAGKERQAIEKLAPYLKEQRGFSGMTTAYVCLDHVCEPPTDRPQKFRQLLESRAGESTSFRLFG